LGDGRHRIRAALLALLAAWALAAPARADYCAGGRPLIFAGLNWESGEFITAVLRALIEKGYGCRTDAIPGNTITLEQAVADDDVQIFAEEWVSRSDVWKKAAAAGRARAVGHPFTGAEEGWYVPAYLVAEGGPAAGLRSVEQLSDPRYVALFRDPEQPDRGRFLNCPSGWTCEGVNSAKLHAYGLDGLYVDFRPGTGPAMDAAITAAYLQRRPLLFYSWMPSPIAGRLKLARLAEPAWTASCWEDLTSARGRHDRGCAAPEADIAYGVSAAFAEAAPELVAVLQKATFPLDRLDAELARMADRKASPEAEALDFLKGSRDLWQGWVDPAAAERIDAALAGKAEGPAIRSAFPAGWVVSIRQPVDDALDRLVREHGGAFRAVARGGLALIAAVDRGLAALPWWLLVGVFAALAWAGSRRPGLAALVALLMVGLGVLGLWDLMLQTLSLMLLSTAITLLLGLPAGILCAKRRGVKALVLPVLDAMQTMPSFVYLIPALMLFGLGKVPAMLATIVYSLPPMIRLTALGLEQVDPEIKEAATSFGVTPWRMLLSVELPLARPTVMAGINQAIMLALSMVVVASMIGARGLGEQVLNGIQTLDIGLGLEAGIGIVVLAFVLDRVTQGFGHRG
jgi:glycine betaine/proline transport system substrate-binding protein